MSNCIWRIHEFDRRDDAVNVLEYVDKVTKINCPTTEWFRSSDIEISKDKTYSCEEVRGFMKFSDIISKNFEKNLKDIFDYYEGTDEWKTKGIFKFQDDMIINSNDDDSKLSFDEEQAITILIESYDDNLDNRCELTDSLDSKYRALCYERNPNEEEKKRFKDFIKTKTSKEITIEDVRKNTIQLLNKLNKKKLFDIYQGIPNSDYTYNDEYDEDNKALQDKLKNKLQAIREAYISKDHILPEEIPLYLDKLSKDDINNKGIEFNITDLQGSSLYPKIYKSLLNQLKTNRKFRDCIDEKLDIKNIHGYNEFMDDVKKKDFDINNPLYIKFIKDACDKFISLHPNDIKDCISKLPFSDDQIEVLKGNICKGDIPFTMMDTITLVFRFIDIHIDIKNLNPDSIKILTKHSKEVLHKIITTSEYFEELNCNGMPSKITQNLKTMYNSLFDTHKSIENPFKNHIKWKWFKPFNTLFGKIILLIFICFIFAKIVDLFSGKDCCPQVPVNK